MQEKNKPINKPSTVKAVDGFSSELKVGSPVHRQKFPEKKTDKEWARWAIEESSDPIIRNPYLKKAITDAEIQKKLDKQRGPHMFDLIYDGMSPHEKGSWNAEQRKKGMDGKTGDVLEKKKPIEPFKIDFNLTPWKK